MSDTQAVLFVLAGVAAFYQVATLIRFYALAAHGRPATCSLIPTYIAGALLIVAVFL